VNMGMGHFGISRIVESGYGLAAGPLDEVGRAECSGALPDRDEGRSGTRPGTSQTEQIQHFAT
jgi:hypothetical protein